MSFFRYSNTFSMIQFNICRTLFIILHCKVIVKQRIYLRAEIQRYFRLIFGANEKKQKVLSKLSDLYSTRNILTMICQKSPTFGYSYITRNILTTICQKSPTFAYSYSTRNILTTICQKSPNFGHSTVLEIF
jgi:hypothetical protein